MSTEKTWVVLVHMSGAPENANLPRNARSRMREGAEVVFDVTNISVIGRMSLGAPAARANSVRYRNIAGRT